MKQTMLRSYGRRVQETSVRSYYDDPALEAQVGLYENMIRWAEDGLTDYEAQALFSARHGLRLPKSTISARRADVSRKHGRHVIVCDGTRRNPVSGKRCLVWKWRGDIFERS